MKPVVLVSSRMRSTPMVGRGLELATFGAALDAAARGSGSVHLLVGEGGIGKTRLAHAVAELARSRGFETVTGRAFPVEQGIPYAPFADAFVPMLRGMPPAMLQVVARGAMNELAALFPPLSTADTAPLSGSSPEFKPRLLDGFARFVQRLAARAPVLITIKNLQWADPSSIELLHYVARGASAHPLLVLITWNDTDASHESAASALTQSLRALHAVTVHRLAALTIGQTAELTARQFNVGPDVLAPFSRALQARTRGNPFYVEETLKALVENGQQREANGRWTGFDADIVDVPRTIRDMLRLRLDGVGADARRIATIAPILGRNH